MTGDQNDMLSRLKAVLPTGWFPDDTPILDGLISGAAAIWSWSWSLLDYVARQRRIATATDVNLDLISTDFLGTLLPRKAGESDDSYRARIKVSIFREEGTRKSVSDVVQSLTGVVPTIFEPARPADTGGYGSAGTSVGTGLGYGLAGGYGSYDLPFEAFITALRAGGVTRAGVEGYSTQQLSHTVTAVGGYGVGALVYLQGEVTGVSSGDEEIYAAINDVRPVATIMWVALGDGPGAPTPTPTPTTTPQLDINFVLDVSRLS